MFSIEELSKTENMMVQRAEQEYGPYFSNAKELVEFTYKFIDEEEVDEEAHIFLMFLSQMNQALHLALLSTIRRHDIQTCMMIRYALESAVLACYALNNTDIDQYVSIDKDGLAREKRKVKDRARSWLETNFKEQSQKIRFIKDQINESMAHGNIIPVFNNFSLHGDNGFAVTLFDINDDLNIRQRFWWIGNTTFGLVDLIASVCKLHPRIGAVDDFEEIMSRYGKENYMLQKELESNKKYQKFINEYDTKNPQ